MKTLSTVHGAISIVNAIATGQGSALGISLETCAEVTLTSDNLVEVIINNDKSENIGLAQECFKLVKMKTSESCGAKITVNSDIPIGRGLKSSSAAATAIVLSCLKAFEIVMTEKEILDLSVQASKNSGVTITGALVDAAACFLGGLVVTNNSSNELLSRVIIDDDYSILIHV
ncbi:MAG: shikimate kinase, partial [Thaumarchaeota archaeon]